MKKEIEEYVIFTHPGTKRLSAGKLKSIDGSYHIVEFDGIDYELLENEVEFVRLNPLNQIKLNRV